MTKKHFEAIAESVNRTYDMVETDAERQLLHILIGNLSENFKTVNPRFDRAKFFEACTE